jgi:hypothetical protein
MEIGNVTLEIRRSGEHATLLLQTRPFGNEIPITLAEVRRLARYARQIAEAWQAEKQEADSSH